MTKNGMTKLGATIQHRKRRGEWAEMCFMMRASELGMEVNKPWSDTASYDFVVEKGRKMARIQVKSTMQRNHDGYRCTIRDCRGGAYAGNPFDFVAAYLLLEDVWYIIPAKFFRGKTVASLFPRYRRSKYEPFREAWHLLPGVSPDRRRANRIDSIRACAEDAEAAEAWINPQFSIPPLAGGPSLVS
jgi:PD-(D/E)XK endonuclease